MCYLEWSCLHLTLNLYQGWKHADKERVCWQMADQHSKYKTANYRRTVEFLELMCGNIFIFPFQVLSVERKKLTNAFCNLQILPDADKLCYGKYFELEGLIGSPPPWNALVKYWRPLSVMDNDLGCKLAPSSVLTQAGLDVNSVRRQQQ